MTPDITISTDTDNSGVKFRIFVGKRLVTEFYSTESSAIVRFSNRKDHIISWSDHIIVDGKLVEEK